MRGVITISPVTACTMALTTTARHGRAVIVITDSDRMEQTDGSRVKVKDQMDSEDRHRPAMTRAICPISRKQIVGTNQRLV